MGFGSHRVIRNVGDPLGHSDGEHGVSGSVDNRVGITGYGFQVSLATELCDVGGRIVGIC